MAIELRRADLPPGPTSRSGRPREYFPALQRLLEEPAGDWWVLATFESATGAKDAKSRIRRGLIEIPDTGWEFHARITQMTPPASELLVRRTEEQA